MRTQRIMLDIGWKISIHYETDTYDAEDILDELISIGCSGSLLRDAKENLWKGAENSGLTFANPEKQRAVIVICRTTSGKEFFNSLMHETLHLLSYFAEAYGLDPYGEDICYVGGDLAMKIHPLASHFMCEGCRKNVRHFLTPP